MRNPKSGIPSWWGSLRSTHPTSIILAASCLLLFAGADWRQFRGTDNTSVGETGDLPATFDAQSNVAWKIDLPGRGPSGPIVVAGRVVVTASSGPRQDQLHVLCFDAGTGKQLWHRQLWATGSTAINGFAALATPTPASDGQRILALYSSSDLACFDLDGNLKWFRGLNYESPTTRNDAGMGSSPLVLGKMVIVQLQNQGESFAVGLDAETGENRWRIERDHNAIWSSPTALRGAKPEADAFLLHGRAGLSVHDPATGKTLAEYAAPVDTIPSVTTCDDRVYLPGVGLHALRWDGAAHTLTRLWYEQRLRSENASPVAQGDRVYTIKSAGVLACADAATGRTLWQLRLTGPFWATPVLAGGRLYCVNHRGLVQAVQLGEEGKLLGTSQLDAGILASPAVAQGAIYFRSDAHLWKVSFPGAPSQ